MFVSLLRMKVQQNFMTVELNQYQCVLVVKQKTNSILSAMRVIKLYHYHLLNLCQEDVLMLHPFVGMM